MDIKDKRREIREGLESRLANLLVLWCGSGQQEARKDAKELVGAWFDWMDSQDVVFKIDKELPELPYCAFEAYPRAQVINKCETTQQRMLEAHFTATERLVDECIAGCNDVLVGYTGDTEAECADDE